MATAPIIGLVVLVVLFLIFRELVLWYWRVNQGIELLKGIDEKLGRLLLEKGPRIG